MCLENCTIYRKCLCKLPSSNGVNLLGRKLFPPKKPDWTSLLIHNDTFNI